MQNAEEYAEIEALLESSSDEEVLEVTAKELEECCIFYMQMWKMKRARAKPCNHRFRGRQSCINFFYFPGQYT